jgi:hypothetical protein
MSILKGSIMTRLVRVDQYADRLVVFVCGYAINANECTMDAAFHLARAIGQDSISVTDYSKGYPSVRVYQGF